MDLLGGEQPQDELAEKVQIAPATLSSKCSDRAVLGLILVSLSDPPSDIFTVKDTA